MYGMIKIHKENNPGRIIMTGSGAAVKNLSIFLKKSLPGSSKSRHKNTRHTTYVKHN